MAIAPRRRTNAAKFSMAHYNVVGNIIKTLPAEIQQVVADRFATEFLLRSNSFDAYQWSKLTGGKVEPGVTR